MWQCFGLCLLSGRFPSVWRCLGLFLLSDRFPSVWQCFGLCLLSGRIPSMWQCFGLCLLSDRFPSVWRCFGLCPLSDRFQSVWQCLGLCLLYWSLSIMDDNVFIFSRGRDLVLLKFKVRRGCTVPNPLTWSSTMKCDGSERIAMTGSVVACSILPETQFAWTHLRIDATQVLSVGVPFSYGSCRRKV